MTNYPRSAYGSTNPNAGYPANGDFAAWGGYCYPGGVPSSLLGTTNYAATVTGQTLKVTMRKELVPLWNLAFEICDRKHGYAIWANRGGEAWGPWGYSNRAISGTNRPSGHSAALSVDINAPYNPYSYTFQSDMPPAMVADLESLGLYWGGRYQDQKFDAMHYGFCRAPSTVASYISKAQAILGGSPSPITPPEEDVLNDDDKKWIKSTVDSSIATALTKTISVSTDDAAQDGNPNTYTIAAGIARVIRLSSLSFNRITGGKDR